MIRSKRNINRFPNAVYALKKRGAKGVLYSPATDEFIVVGKTRTYVSPEAMEQLEQREAPAEQKKYKNVNNGVTDNLF